MTIPELRRAFEHMDDMIHECHTSGHTQEECIKLIRKEWLGTFEKELSKASAEKLLKNHVSHHKKRTRKRGGASVPLMGANIDHVMRSGYYTDAAHGGMGDYYLKGLSTSVPEIAGPASISWPSPSPSMGGNSVMKGGRRGVRRSGGSMGALLTAAFNRPVGGSSPSSPFYDIQGIVKGQLPGASPSPFEDTASYRATFPTKAITY